MEYVWPCSDNASLKAGPGSEKYILSSPPWLWDPVQVTLPSEPVSSYIEWGEGSGQVPSSSILSFTECYPLLVEFFPSQKVSPSGQEIALDVSGTGSHGCPLKVE